MKTLKNLFKEDDFESVDRREDAHKKAQQILDQYIEENGVEIFGKVTGDKLKDWNYAWTVISAKSQEHTHVGILIDIQEIQKKQCEHKEAVYVEDQDKTWFKCRDCGKPVKAKGWEGV